MQDIERALSEHPCYDENAHREFARMHIPVAPKCNIQCNYCNRKFDCCNESRPGVTSEVLSPEQAVEKIRIVKEKIPRLSVIGIAGPGDPLANEATFESLELIGKEFPELTLCVSTNGLMLPEYAERLHSLGVRFLTVTMNSYDPAIASKIYEKVILNGCLYEGVEGAEILIERQLKGITACVKLGMKVKVNIVMVPGINDAHIPDLVKKVKGMGAYIVNILPLIPVQGTKFSELRAPTPQERKEMMDRCEIDAKMMRHCRQCRADAIGLLDEDRSSEFMNLRGCGSDCFKGTNLNVSIDTNKDKTLIAVATSDGVHVDSGFGSASEFRIYSFECDEPKHIDTIRIDRSSTVAGSDHRKHIETIVSQLSKCRTVIVEEIGPLPMKMLSNTGIDVVVTSDSVDASLKRSKP